MRPLGLVGVDVGGSQMAGRVWVYHLLRSATWRNDGGWVCCMIWRGERNLFNGFLDFLLLVELGVSIKYRR